LSQQEQHDESRPFHLEGGGLVFDKPKNQEEIARETREREQHEFERDQVKTNKRLKTFTGFLVIGTFVGTGIGIWQASIAQTSANAAREAAKAAQETVREARTTREQSVRDAQQARELSANEAEAADQRNMAQLEASAKQNQTTLQTAINNSRLDLRPWVMLSRFELSVEPAENVPVTGTFWVVNTGKTPAMHVVTSSGIRSYTERPEPPQFFFSGMGQVGSSAGMLAPGGVGDFHFPTGVLTLNREQARSYTSGGTVIYGSARIEYDDGFADSKPHWTSICVKHIHGRPLNEVGFCGTGNDIDHQ